MDISVTDNEKITIDHFIWLGFKNENGVLIHELVPGEVQYTNGEFWYCFNNMGIKKIELAKDINDIYLQHYYNRK